MQEYDIRAIFMKHTTVLIVYDKKNVCALRVLAVSIISYDSSFFPCRIHGDDDWRIGKTATFLRHFNLSLEVSGDNIEEQLVSTIPNLFSVILEIFVTLLSHLSLIKQNVHTSVHAASVVSDVARSKKPKQRRQNENKVRL
jgi:hypothetical protein